jgi:ERCC4-like helicases
MTATLPSEQEKATEILTRLRISSVAERTEISPDVKPYIKETNTEWINVELPPRTTIYSKIIKIRIE